MRFEMRCPQCGYHYYIIGCRYEFESCPICGYGADFKDFLLRTNPLTAKEKSDLKNWGNMQYAISRKYVNSDPVRAEFYHGRSVAAGKVAKMFNPSKKRKVSKTQKVGNAFEGMGIILIPLFIGGIVWLDRKYGE